MNKVRIVFFGTPEFAVAGVRNLVDKGFDVAAIVTAPDKPAGRGRQLQQSAMKQFAEERSIPVMQPVKLKDPEFLKEVSQLEANLFIVVAFRMLPAAIWQMPELGTFNLHASLLPQYRGAAPINWAIINGETKTGITTFFIDEKIDTGNMILQEEVSIESNMNAGQLHDVLMNKGSELIEKTVRIIQNGNVVRIPQDSLQSGTLKEAPKIFKEDCRIDWSKSTKNIFNKIRGLSPYPAAWAVLKHKSHDKQLTFKIFAAQLSNQKAPYLAPMATEDGILIGLKEGAICISELQLQGKKKMKALDFLRGFSIEEYIVI